MVTLQDTRLHHNDRRARKCEIDARDAGFSLHLASPYKDAAVGGTAVLFSTGLGDVRPKIRTLPKGEATIADFTHNNMDMRIASVYARSGNSGAATRARSALFRWLRHGGWITNRTILTGDMNCVPDPALDVRSDAVTPYNNT